MQAEIERLRDEARCVRCGGTGETPTEALNQSGRSAEISDAYIVCDCEGSGKGVDAQKRLSAMLVGANKEIKRLRRLIGELKKQS